MKPERIPILNVAIDNYTITELLSEMKKGVLITPNVDHLVKVQKDKEFYSLYKKAEYITLDSQIVRLALKFLRRPAKELITGSNFFPAFCNYHKDNKDIKIFLLGAAEGVAKTAKERINTRIGREIIIGALSPSFGFEKSEEECQSIIKIINESGANVLAVGVGAPKQEKWIFKYRDQLTNINIFMAIGATIDFEAGNIQRAPKMVQKLHIEWLYRLFKEPGRLWKRYLIDDIPFFWLIFKERFGWYKDPFLK